MMSIVSLCNSALKILADQKADELGLGVLSVST